MADRKLKSIIGPPGPAGKSILNGTGVPLNTFGNDGDFFLDLDTYELYGPKASGVWPSPPVQLATGQGQVVERIPFTITSGQINSWLTVPTPNFSEISDAISYDDSNSERIAVGIRLTTNGTVLQINSKKAQTITLHVEGYQI